MDDGSKLANIVFDFPLIARRILMSTDKKAIPIFVTSTITQESQDIKFWKNYLKLATLLEAAKFKPNMVDQPPLTKV
jgi:hypothetical protein